MEKTSLEQIRNDPKIINSFDYSNCIHSNLPIELLKLNEKYKQEIKNLEEKLIKDKDKLDELLQESIKSLENENLSKIQEVEKTDNKIIKQLESSYNEKIQVIDNKYT